MVGSMMRNSFVLAVSIVVMLVGTVVGEPVARHRVPTTPVQSAQPVQHDTKFHAVPDSKLEIRALVYDGSVNGKLTVEVRNRGKAAQRFSASGLYFVPEGDPDTAPQRLGAVGPLQIAGAAKDDTEIEVASGSVVKLTLDVFCIDSQRPSPSPDNVFDVGTTRMPKDLARTIEHDADVEVAAKRSEGAAAPRAAAKSAIQGKVWESRNSKWVPLDGEGKQEAGK
jgi:hypothetical protein